MIKRMGSWQKHTPLLSLTSSTRLIKKVSIVFVALLFFGVSMVLPAQLAQAANVPLHWQAETVPGDMAGWRGLAWSPELGLFVAVADSTTQKLMTSTDGVNWQRHTPPEDNDWRSITWSPELGLFVAVSVDGTNQVMTSSDGFNWTPRTVPENNEWYDVTWSPELDLFVAVASNAGPGTHFVMTSPDGFNWTPRSGPNGDGWVEITWSSELGLFVATGGSGTNRIMTSPNGINWTPRTTPNQGWYGLTWSPELSLFVVVDGGNDNGPRILTSSDGITWTPRPTPIDGGSNYLADVAWSPELRTFVAVAYSGTQRILTSTDGITWVPHTAPVDNNWWKVVWSSELGKFVSLSVDGTTESAMTGVPESTIPNAPTTLQATAAGSTQINLSWNAATSDNPYTPPTGYKIERSVSGGAFSTVVANTHSTTTTYQDSGLDPGTQYMYRVSALNAAGTSSPSNEASATTAVSPTSSTPGAPGIAIPNTPQTGFGGHQANVSATVMHYGLLALSLLGGAVVVRKLSSHYDK